MEIANYSLTDGLISRDYALKVDFSIVMSKGISYIYTFVAVACIAAISVLLFIIFPMLLLFFYPMKVFRRLIFAKCVHNRLRIFLYIFINKYHYCYRDGLDGTKDMRSFSGIYLLLRIILYFSGLLSRVILRINEPFIYGFVFSVTALLVALSQPYKKTYMNIVDSILLSHLATLGYIMEALHKTPDWSHLFLSLMQTIILLPFLVVFLLTTYRLICRIFQHLHGSLSPSRCLTCLKSAIAKFCGGSTPQNLSTYGTIN